MVRVRVRLGYTMAICLVLQHQVSTAIFHLSLFQYYQHKLKSQKSCRLEGGTTIVQPFQSQYYACLHVWLHEYSIEALVKLTGEQCLFSLQISTPHHKLRLMMESMSISTIIMSVRYTAVAITYVCTRVYINKSVQLRNNGFYYLHLGSMM